MRRYFDIPWGPPHDVQPPDQSGCVEALARLSLGISVPGIRGRTPFPGSTRWPNGLSWPYLRCSPARRRRSHSFISIQSEPDLHCHLPMRNLVILEVAAHLGDFKPPHIADCLASSRDRVVHCVFDAVWRGTDQLNLFVDVVTHERIKPLHVASGEHIPRSKDAGHFSKGSKIFS